MEKVGVRFCIYLASRVTTTVVFPTSPTLYTNSVRIGFFNIPQNLYVQGLWDGAYSLSPLSEKTRKSNRLYMSLQRQHFLLSYLRTLIVVQARVRTSGLLLRRASPSFFLSFFSRRERTLLAGNCSFYCKDDVSLYIFIRNSKYDSLHIFQFKKMYLATRSCTLQK